MFGEFVMPKSLILFHTDGCHLCDIASAILTELKLEFSRQDICEDLTLAEQYGSQIPVLKSQSGQELFWPFDSQAVKQFWRKELEFSSN